MKRSPQSSGPQRVAKGSRESKGQHWECTQCPIYQYFIQHLNVTSSIETKTPQTIQNTKTQQKIQNKKTPEKLCL
jgi:hypothetical protein